MTGHCFGALLAAVCAIFACTEPDPPQTAAARSTELIFSGFNYIAHGGEKASLQLQAEQLIWRKRHFGVFSIGPFREIAMRNATLSLLPASEISASTGAGDGLASNFEGLDWSGTFGLRSVTRVTARPLRIQLNDGSGEVYRIDAAEAKIDSKRLVIDMKRGVSLKSRSGQHLAAGSARWLGRRLRIRGPYVLEEGGHKKLGSDGVFVLEDSGVLRRIAAG
jgi:hypothetical protein